MEIAVIAVLLVSVVVLLRREIARAKALPAGTPGADLQAEAMQIVADIAKEMDRVQMPEIADVLLAWKMGDLKSVHAKGRDLLSSLRNPEARRALFAPLAQPQSPPADSPSQQ